jgi:hypothetical protein
VSSYHKICPATRQSHCGLSKCSPVEASSAVHATAIGSHIATE